MAWAAARPQGFGLRIMTDHEDYPELAELYKHDRMSPLWFLNATLAGTIIITKASGADQELATVEEALARVRRWCTEASANSTVPDPHGSAADGDGLGLADHAVEHLGGECDLAVLIGPTASLQLGPD